MLLSLQTDTFRYGPLRGPKTSISEGLKLEAPLTFSDLCTHTHTQNCTLTTNAEQGRPGVRRSSQIRDGYRFTGTSHDNARTHTHALSLPSQGRQQPIDQPGAGNSLGQRGQYVRVCVRDDKTNSLSKAALTSEQSRTFRLCRITSSSMMGEKNGCNQTRTEDSSNFHR